MKRFTVCAQRVATKRDHRADRPAAERPDDRSNLIVPTDYFETSLTNLVFCYRSGDLVSLHLDFPGFPVVGARSTIEDNEASMSAKCTKRMVQYG